LIKKIPAIRKKSYVEKGTVPKLAKEKKLSVNEINTKYKRLLEDVRKKYPHSLSKEQKQHLKDMFIKNPSVHPSEVVKILGYLSGVGKGKK